MKKEVSKASEMLPHIEFWKKSGLSQKSYCDQHQIIPHVFYYWLKRYRIKHSAPGEKGFIPVKLPPVTSTIPATIELVGTNGNRVLFYGHVEPSYLKSLLS